MASILPVLPIWTNFNSNRRQSRGVCLWSNASHLAVCQPGHIGWFSVDGAITSLFEAALDNPVVHGAIVKLELVELHATEEHWGVARVGDLRGDHRLDKEVLVVVESVGSVTEVEGFVINELLAVSRDGNDDLAGDSHRRGVHIELRVRHQGGRDVSVAVPYRQSADIGLVEACGTTCQ